MSVKIWFQVIGLLVCTFQASRGSVIVFQSTPTEIKDGLTGSVTLRCGLNDTAASSSVIGRRDVTRSTDNMEDVSSIIVMKNGQDVASVSNSHSAKVVGGASNLQVTGDVAGARGERGFLQLTYTAPSTGESGEFVCEVNAVSESGHARVFTTSLEINISTPTVPDLVKYVRELQNEINNLKHVESGRVSCGSSLSGWNHNPDGTKTKDIAVKFRDNYNTTPLVNIGTTTADTDHAINLRYTGSVQSVDTNGFTFQCKTWSDSKIYGLDFSWLSVPQ